MTTILRGCSYLYANLISNIEKSVGMHFVFCPTRIVYPDQVVQAVQTVQTVHFLNYRVHYLSETFFLMQKYLIVL